ncbi:Methyltransferase domain-containing protein [Arenibacter palladensis]|uniref:Methyltransferase domain-containing protein n=1 Tax=Arenibacter palladensis TaxID=237373 RepID=A0A1M4Z6H0_9FLAO|nr:methyltransferase domain-containing protein [Arenibacter palladensis]SHF13673.1 Methyltransferase domain-containing protein [Arenibacter palladensis]
MNFKRRSCSRELMDDPLLDTILLQKVYTDINRVNTVLQGFSLTLRAIEKIIEENPRNSYTIMDMGCGDGAMLTKVAAYYKNKPVSLDLIGVDLNSKSIALAKENAKEFSNISFLELDILGPEAKNLQCDILLCTLTMHHFDSKDIPLFLDQFVKLSRLGIVINDLQRSKVSYYLFQLFSLIFIKTKIAKHDGLVSIKSAFTKLDLEAFSINLPHVEHDICWRWAFRYLWIMRIKGKQLPYGRD